ncbi:MAG TPA: zf-HC2 domain-containing protein [Stenomitos sp.]
MDNLTPLQSERFELLSAYLDGEVSATERKQVEEWLASDVQFQQTYRKMLALQQGVRSLPTPSTSVASDVLAQKVLSRVERQPRLWLWGGLGAATALVVGTLSGLLTGNQNGMLQVAQSPSPAAQPHISALVPSDRPSAPERNDPKTLMIALERPPIDIPDVPSSKATGLEHEGTASF